MSDLVDLIVPIEQEGTKAVVLKWLKAVGEPVALEEPVVELETDKVAVEVAAPAAGVLVEQSLAVDAEVEPGMVLGRIQAGALQQPPPPLRGPPPPEEKVSAHPPSPLWGEPRRSREGVSESRLSPSVRRLVREGGIDPGALTGTGRGGRLTRADVAAALERRGGPRLIPHDRMRRQIAEHMSRSLTIAPHVTAVFEADFSAIIAHRQAHKAEAPLTYTAYFVAAAAKAMAAAPAVNGRWHEDHLEIFEDVDIGVGVALGEKGLIVPVIRRAQSLSLSQIARALADLTLRARAGRLGPADVRGGTFSISNHGVSGSLIAAPIIINQPQSAILGIGKLEKRVVVREVGGADAIQIRPMAYVSLTIDHRVIDAAQTNAWLARFVEILQSWGQ